jgi:hypothetical protein
MDYYRFGSASMNAPGGMTLIGLMDLLTTADGTAPDALVLVNGQMDPESCSAPTVHSCGFLVHLLTGAATAIVGDESVRLIAHNTVRIPPETTYQFSTRDSIGMTALVIIPQHAEPSQPYESTALPFCFGGGMSLQGKPQSMALRSLDMLRSLTRLTSEGCRVVMVQMARGNLHREGIFATLLPRYASDPKALRAFIWMCNAHPAAPWWLDRTRAQRAIEEGVTKMLTS